MLPTLITYDICRHYITDYEPYIPNASKLLGYVRSRNFEILAQCTSLLPYAQHTRESWRHYRQIEAFFKKNSSFVEGDLSEVALGTFLRAEEDCRETNFRLEYWSLLPASDKKWNSEIQKMKHYISSTLGDYDAFFDSIPSRIEVTSGATATRSRRSAKPHLKMGTRNISCTSAAIPYITALAGYYGINRLSFKPTECNRVTFVPKSFKTERTIACEPDWNIPFQLAFDDYVKQRLRRRGIDLSDQGLNQSRAKAGSIHGHLATIDLAAASDSLSENLVAMLLPDFWYKYVSDFRCKQYLIEGTADRNRILGFYNKFSSMGNGTTFPLETLVFAAACYAVGSTDFSVYGDDIIIETSKSQELVNLLAFIGFQVNTEKSFSTGPFRESCGKDYWNGADVTPFYIRKMDKRKAVISHNINGLASICMPYGNLAVYLKQLYVDFSLYTVPFNYNTLSGVFVDPHTAYAEGNIVTRKGDDDQRTWLGVYFKSYVSKTKSDIVEDVRTYSLWFLNRNSGKAGLSHSERSISILSLLDSRARKEYARELGDDPLDTKRVPHDHHKTVRKWVRWFLPPEGAPLHLYWWSEFITR